MPANLENSAVVTRLKKVSFHSNSKERKELNVQIKHSGGPNMVSCEQCMLSSSLTPRSNVCSFVVLKRPPYIMVPVTVTTYWYDNYGLAVLKQLQDLMCSRWLVGLLIVGNSALIITITTVIVTVIITVTVIVNLTLAAMSLTKQVQTAQYVEKSYFRCLE